MQPFARIKQGQTSKMELFVLIVNSWNSRWLEMFFSKSFILDVRLRSEYTFGTVITLWLCLWNSSGNFFPKNCILNLWKGLQICICLHWVWQFLNEISKAFYEETQKNGNKYVPLVPRNACLKIFLNFQFWMANYQLGSLWHDSNLYECLHL